MRFYIRCILFLLLISGVSSGLAREPVGGSDPTTDSLQTIEYAKRAKDLVARDRDSALIYARKSYKLAESTKSEYLLAVAQDVQGLVHEARGEWKEALVLIDKALRIRLRHQWHSEAALSYLHLGNVYFHEGGVHERKAHFDAADKSFGLALEKYKLALNLFIEAEDSLGQAQTHLNIGSAYYGLWKNQEALESYQRSASIFKQLGATSHLPSTISNIGVIYHEEGKIDSAAYYYNSAQKAFKKEGDLRNWINANVNLAGIYEEANPSRALAYLSEADSLAVLLNSGVQRSLIQQYLYTIYSDQKDYQKALHHLENYRVLTDSILNSQFKTEELNIRYQTARKEELIERQKARSLQQELDLAKAEARQKMLWVGGGILLAALIFVFWRQRVKGVIQRQKEQLHLQEMADLERSKQLEAAGAMLAGQEKERIRVAEDLHDRLASTLVAARMQFEVGLKGTLAENTHLAKAQNLLVRAIHDTRDISHNMISGVLVNLGLVPALQDLKESLEATGRLEVELLADEVSRLDPEVELQLFRVTQELVNNTLRHSDAVKLKIELRWQDGYLHLRIEDNGKGFEIEKVTKGVGLSNIERRLASVGAELQVSSVLGKGSRFIIKLELPYESMRDTAG